MLEASRKMKTMGTRILPTCLVLLFSCSNAAQAWFLRLRYEDATVVERSELIVVGHLERDTIQYVPHEKKGHEGASWEHHAVLAITEILKGSCYSERIPIIIHYGLYPRIGGTSVAEGFRPPHARFPKDPSPIYILDRGNSAWDPRPLVRDAAQDNLWFLRRRSGVFGREPGTGAFGIVDPEDLQSLQCKDYFLTYLADNPQDAVRAYIRENPEKTERAQRYFDHLEIQRILEIEDPRERFDKLLPYFLNRTTWNMKPEAKAGIIACGPVAGDRLRTIFADPKHNRIRQTIILMWRDMQYRQAAPLLIELLWKHDRYWAKQTLEEGWWNSSVDSEQTRQRRDIYGEVYYAVCALRAFRLPETRKVLEATRDRWKAIDFDNPQIVEACEAALRELPEVDASASPADTGPDRTSGLTCPADGGRGASLIDWAAIDRKGILYGRQKYTTETLQ